MKVAEGTLHTTIDGDGAGLRQLARLLFTLVLILVIAIYPWGCSTAATAPPKITPPAAITPADRPQLPARGYFLGVLPTPGTEQSFADAYLAAASHAEFVPVWGKPTPFYELARELSGSWGQTFVKQYTRGNGMFPVVHLSFMSTGLTLASLPGIKNPSLANAEWRQAYKKAALDVVRAVKPRYLSLGNEVNRWYEKFGASSSDPNGFQHYVTLYHEIYDAVKKLSPETRIFCTFAREIVAENREANLEVLKMFDPQIMDMLVFTSYPYAVKGIQQPADLPNDYYSRILNYMPGKPFGLSEVAWAALEPFGGEAAQAEFLTQVTGRLTLEQGINLHLVGWPWLNALDENDTVALIKKDGTPRLAYSVWQKLSGTGQ